MENKSWENECEKEEVRESRIGGKWNNDNGTSRIKMERGQRDRVLQMEDR